MKKLVVGVFVVASLIACTNTEKKTEMASQKMDTIAHIYKPAYTDNFKIGDAKNVLLAEQFHKAVFEKDLKQIGEMIADTAVFYMEDGTVLKGKDTLVAYIGKNFLPLTFNNFKIDAIIPVVGENGHQWVDIWDEADITTPDGKSQKYNWMDAYRYENGKIVEFIGYGKAIK
jgi:hypothetical protein